MITDRNPERLSKFRKDASLRRGPLFRYLEDDHLRLENLLDQAQAEPGQIDYPPYAQFRAGLLKHIAMEEKILLPAAQRLRGGQSLPAADRLRRDHGALAALLVPTPTPSILAKIRQILDAHNPIEEEAGGVYELCEQLARGEAELLLAEMRGMRDIRLAAHVDGPHVMEAARRALKKAGYSF
jgi:hypothetical protein